MNFSVCTTYLVSDLHKEDKDDDNKQVVEDTDNSNDDVDNLDWKVSHEVYIRYNAVIFHQRLCNVQDITRQR